MPLPKRNEALLANAVLDLQRYATLVKTNAVSRQQLDNQLAAVVQLQAQLRLDQAQIDRAKAFAD
jgi:membrane fusion protein, multidrug efflux system